MITSNTPPAQGGSAPISLANVRALFGRPQRIAESDFLRREIAGRMFERLDLIRVAPEAVLDAGCGEGADLAVLRQRYPDARLIGLDGSLAMLGGAVERQRSGLTAMNRLFSRLLPKGPAGGRSKPAELLCGDFARLPFGPATVGLVWSNLALHWHPRPDEVIAEWRRVLRDEGLLMFSCFGPDTFRELRAVSKDRNGVPQVLPFVDMHDLGDMLVHAGFATPVMDMEILTLTYDTVEKMLADVRALGGNPLQTRAQGLAGRASRDHLYRALEGGRDARGKLSLTIEVIYGHAFRPVPRTTSAGESIVRFAPRK
ncbi:methyltransferase domain-containing protein [Lacisediminimonas profundi]|uniref:methyltransferase domain-containing protein n=1 Tax=Lacisediminimonas profundi TaxID=2603856 RepID=UPI00124BB99E|nr:methyltransferase domain-containing protein [Lacisediminimonas profundi]